MMLGLLALLVFGPQDLPRIIKKVMHTVRALRTAASDFQTEVHSALEYESQQADLKKRQRQIAADAETPALETEVAPEPTEETQEQAEETGESAPVEVAEDTDIQPASEELIPEVDEPVENSSEESIVETEAEVSLNETAEAQEPQSEEHNEAATEDSQAPDDPEDEAVEEDEDEDGPGLPMASPKKRVESN